MRTVLRGVKLKLDMDLSEFSKRGNDTNRLVLIVKTDKESMELR